MALISVHLLKKKIYTFYEYHNYYIVLNKQSTTTTTTIYLHHFVQKNYKLN